MIGAITFDVVGGMVAFQLPETRATYAKKTAAERLGFVAAHVHPFAMAALGCGTWRRAGLRYAVTVGATEGLGRVVRDPVALRAVAGALGVGAATLDGITDRSDSRWFGPVYALKLVGGHAGVEGG